jgi:hypothetical protein
VPGATRGHGGGGLPRHRAAHGALQVRECVRGGGGGAGTGAACWRRVLPGNSCWAVVVADAALAPHPLVVVPSNQHPHDTCQLWCHHT